MKIHGDRHKAGVPEISGGGVTDCTHGVGSTLRKIHYLLLNQLIRKVCNRNTLCVTLQIVTPFGRSWGGIHRCRAINWLELPVRQSARQAASEQFRPFIALHQLASNDCYRSFVLKAESFSAENNDKVLIDKWLPHTRIGVQARGETVHQNIESTVAADKSDHVILPWFRFC